MSQSTQQPQELPNEAIKKARALGYVSVIRHAAQNNRGEKSASDVDEIVRTKAAAYSARLNTKEAKLSKVYEAITAPTETGAAA